MAKPVRARRLTDDEGQTLLRIVRRGRHGTIKVRRAMMVLASASGNTNEAIAALVAADPDTVRDVIHAFNDRGLLCLDPKWAGGRPRRITADNEAYIVAVAQQRPKALGRPFTHWSLRKLAGYLSHPPAGVRRVTIGRQRLGELLHAHGVSFQRTHTWKETSDPDADAKLDGCRSFEGVWHERDLRVLDSPRLRRVSDARPYGAVRTERVLWETGRKVGRDGSVTTMDSIRTKSQVGQTSKDLHPMTFRLATLGGGDQRFGGSPCGGDQPAAPAAAADDDTGAVEQRVQLGGEHLGIPHVCPGGQFCEQLMDRGTVGVGGPLDLHARGGLGAGPRERAATIRTAPQPARLRVEHREDAVMRIREPPGGGAQFGQILLVPGAQVRGDELFLAAEQAVQRCLGHPGVLDHAVDADGVHTLAVEELVGGGKQAFAGERAGALLVM